MSFKNNILTGKKISLEEEEEEFEFLSKIDWTNLQMKSSYIFEEIQNKVYNSFFTIQFLIRFWQEELQSPIDIFKIIKRVQILSWSIVFDFYRFVQIGVHYYDYDNNDLYIERESALKTIIIRTQNCSMNYWLHVYPLCILLTF